MIEYVAAVCTEVGLVKTDVQKLKGPWLAEIHSSVSQIAGVALKNDQKRSSVFDTKLGSIRILTCMLGR